MLGLVARRFTVRAGRMRALGAGVAVFGMLAAGAITASAQLLPLATPSPTCLLDLTGSCLVSTSTTSSTPTPSPTSLCVVILCTPTPDPGTTTSGSTPCPVTCVSPLPVNTNCSVTTDPTCLLTPSPTACQTNCGGTGGGGGGGNTPGSTPGGRTTTSSSSSSSFAAGLGLGGGGNGTIPNAGTTVPLGLSVASVPPVEQLGPASGLQFGHAPILWPLFGLLDLIALAAVFRMVRRSRSADLD